VSVGADRNGASPYRQALDLFRGNPRNAGWAGLARLVDAAGRATALADLEVAAGKAILPPPGDVFAALRLTPLGRVRAVILGQDPYPTPGHAHGLAFSAGPGARTMPASLRNIATELRADLGVEAPQRGDLTPWAEAGVLLLNTVLTVEAGKAGAHANWPWREVAKEAVSAVSQARPHVVFLLWGLKAQRHAAQIDGERHLVIASEHPSPLSAYRGFFGSKPFSRANAWLAAHGEKEIPWGR
jgi:uracil-DNA glycosylase